MDTSALCSVWLSLAIILHNARHSGSQATHTQRELLTTSTEHPTHGRHYSSLKSNLTPRFQLRKSKRRGVGVWGSEYGPLWPPPREYYLGHFRAPPFLLRRAQSGSLRAPSGPVDARPGEGTARPGIPGLLPETPGKTPGLAPGMDRRPNPE